MASLDDRPTLLAIQHVPWETPHRILDLCGSALAVHTAKPLAGQELPDHDEVAGAVAMGGPMNVDETDRFPGLAAEREWLAEAARRGMPVLGICLGAQLLARALGAEVRPGEGVELGFAPVEVSGDVPVPSVVEAHLRADRNLDTATAALLGRMFRAAYVEATRNSQKTAQESDQEDK